MADLAAHGATFAKAVSNFGSGAPAILCHDDADGLSAGAILARAFDRAGRGPAHVRVIGRGESAWSTAIHDELAPLAPGGIVVTDLGVQAGVILPGVPTILVDHHVPRSMPGDPSARRAVLDPPFAPSLSNRRHRGLQIRIRSLRCTQRHRP